MSYAMCDLYRANVKLDIPSQGNTGRQHSGGVWSFSLSRSPTPQLCQENVHPSLHRSPPPLVVLAGPMMAKIDRTLPSSLPGAKGTTPCTHHKPCHMHPYPLLKVAGIDRSANAARSLPPMAIARIPEASGSGFRNHGLVVDLSIY